jgi:YD repeat-containing protein
MVGDFLKRDFLIWRENKMPSKMRYGLLMGIVVLGLLFAPVILSYAETVTYIYDELNRLKQVEYGDGTKIMFTYDQAGNRQYVGLLDTAPPITTASPPGGTYGTAQSVTLT